MTVDILANKGREITITFDTAIIGIGIQPTVISDTAVPNTEYLHKQTTAIFYTLELIKPITYLKRACYNVLFIYYLRLWHCAFDMIPITKMLNYDTKQKVLAVYW